MSASRPEYRVPRSADGCATVLLVLQSVVTLAFVPPLGGGATPAAAAAFVASLAACLVAAMLLGANSGGGGLPSREARLVLAAQNACRTCVATIVLTGVGVVANLFLLVIPAGRGGAYVGVEAAHGVLAIVVAVLAQSAAARAHGMLLALDTAALVRAHVDEALAAAYHGDRDGSSASAVPSAPPPRAREAPWGTVVGATAPLLGGVDDYGPSSYA
jgi:hypothetical protein